MKGGKNVSSACMHPSKRMKISLNSKHMRGGGGGLVLPKGSRSGTFQNNKLGTRGQRPRGGWGEIKKKGIFFLGKDWYSHGKVGADWDIHPFCFQFFGL